MRLEGPGEPTEDEISEAQRPIVADLRAAGFDVQSPQGLYYDESVSWSRALPILARHLERGGYPDLLMYRVARLFGRPEGLPFWSLLDNCYSSPRGRSEQAGAAYALATLATDDRLDDLVRFIRLDGADGRWEFIEPIVRFGGEEGVEVLAPFADEYEYYVSRALKSRKAASARPRRYARAKKQLVEAIAARPEPMLGADAVEWSTSFDLPDWKRFAKRFRTQLGGELDAPLGEALFAAILSAPEDDEQHVLVNTRYGVVRIGWFIDDVDVVDSYIFGSQEVHDLCDDLFEKYLPDL